MRDQGRCEDFAFGGGGGEVRFTAWIVSIHLILWRPRGAIMVGAEQKFWKFEFSRPGVFKPWVATQNWVASTPSKVARLVLGRMGRNACLGLRTYTSP
jgi:hypothetical protein